MQCAAALSTKETYGTAVGLAMGFASIACVFVPPASSLDPVPSLSFLPTTPTTPTNPTPNRGLVGTPISGQLVPHGYLALSLYAATTLLVASGFFVVGRLLLSRRLWARV